MNQHNFPELQQMLCAAFGLDDLPELLDHLGLHLDNLAGETIQAKVRDLVGLMQRQRRLPNCWIRPPPNGPG